jgi:hypothetical protein
MGAAAATAGPPARALAQAHRVAPREIDIVRFQGHASYRVRGAAGQVLVDASRAEGTALAALPDEAVVTALRALRGAAGTPVLERLTRYDDLYYASAGKGGAADRPLPVWRAGWADGVTLYADPASARLLLRADPGTPWQRVLYNGLHSFDFAPLLARPPLRATLVVGLCVLGLALCGTGCVLAWRVLVPARRASHRNATHRPAAAPATDNRKYSLPNN